MSTQSRKSGRATTQNSAETLESPSPREACLSVRLWSAPAGSEQAQSLWENDSPAACLTLDLIAASEGLPTARRGEVLVASFPTFTSAAFASTGGAGGGGGGQTDRQGGAVGMAGADDPATDNPAQGGHGADRSKFQLGGLQPGQDDG